MIRSVDGKTPRIHPTAFIAETAYIAGDVEIGAESSVWFGTVIRGDLAPIKIGRATHIEDNCVLHCDNPMEIGDEVTIGHGAVVHCAKVGDRSLIGNNATLLDDAEIGEASIIAAGAVVTPRTVIPPGSLAAGVPAQVRGSTSDSERGRERLASGQRFAGTHYADLMVKYRAAGLGDEGQTKT